MFNNKLKNIRKSKGLSMEELADKYNEKFGGKMNKSTISRYENNLQEPMFTVVKNLAELFGVTVDYLADENYDNLWEEEKPSTLKSATGNPLIDEIMYNIDNFTDEQLDELARYIKVLKHYKSDE